MYCKYYVFILLYVKLGIIRTVIHLLIPLLFLNYIIIDFAGFMKHEFGRDHVKLHVTLLNSKYRGKSQVSYDEESNGYQNKKPFDATQLLEKFADFDFGVAELTDIYLSQMHSFGDDGYYQTTCVVSCAPGSTS